MKQIKKIIGINLIILLVYTFIIQCIGQLEKDQHGQVLLVIVFNTVALIAHVVMNLLFAIFFSFNDKNSQGKAFLLSAIVVLLVGFSCCWGNMILAERI